MRRSGVWRLFSKPITQGYVSQLPPPPASRHTAGLAWSRAMDRHSEVRQYYHAGVHNPNYRHDTFTEGAAEEADYEAYQQWYTTMYPGVALEEGAAASGGPSNRALDDSAVVQDQRENYDTEGVEEELEFWKKEFTHGSFVK
ncbi:hypothetical protein ADEAN_000587700 [Angomonas deanei]|uniref:Uncharacterized protein n=1 Tax=Angomonas deanei TaxID=59799 RepID=A0A7G2CFU3_9TRYP|nr:hypothetical protein ADEAN_000587700 [Angomonas deanei]